MKAGSRGHLPYMAPIQGGPQKSKPLSGIIIKSY